MAIGICQRILEVIASAAFISRGSPILKAIPQSTKGPSGKMPSRIKERWMDQPARIHLSHGFGPQVGRMSDRTPPGSAGESIIFSPE